MFGVGSLSGTGLGGPDPEQERDPPPGPTPITFPKYEPSESRQWTDDSPPPVFRPLFAKILRPSDITDRHANALNVTVLPICSCDELVPNASDGSSYLPSLEPQPDSNETSADDSSQSDPATARRRKDLEDRVFELQIENDLAFQVLRRAVPKDVKPPKLAYMRKFFEGLESMSQYWDCSLDHYYEVVDSKDGEESCPKRQRLETKSRPDTDADARISSLAERPRAPAEDAPSMDNQESGGSDATSTNDQKDEVRNGTDSNANEQTRRTRSASATPEPRSSMRYKGRRTETGRSMPDQFRADTVKAFVEGTIWPFRASLSPPRMMPIVQFGKLNLPVRQTAGVYRLPNDRMKARQGWQTGPIISVQARAETDFFGEDGLPIEDKWRLDYMREIGGLLQLAQERHRDGKTEVKPGEGKWYTTEPRWGGGEGGEVQNEFGNSDMVAVAEELVEGAKEGSNKKKEDASKSRKKRTPAVMWKELKPGRGYWDPKTEYKAIGTHPESEYDEVYLVSSLNHHISILKMTIHGAYMDFVTSGIMPEQLPMDSAWCSPKLQRTKWFDLFEKDERQEAFQGLWGVMSYLTRES